MVVKVIQSCKTMLRKTFIRKKMRPIKGHQFLIFSSHIVQVQKRFFFNSKKLFFPESKLKKIKKVYSTMLHQTSKK